MVKTVDETKGQCEADMILVDAKNTCNQSIAKKMLEVAELKSKTIENIGQGES